MKYAFRSLLLFAGLLAMMSCARAHGPGGGHGGGGHASGSHSGFGSGHSAGRALSGHPSGHFVSRSLRIFGHHGNVRASGLARRRAFFRHRTFFGSACAGFFPHRAFAGGFDCFSDALLLDPFFLGAYSMLGGEPDFNSPDIGDSFLSSDLLDSMQSAAPPPSNGVSDNQVTLLQLLDGSMYGLTSYRVVGDQLRYTTTYGGQNSVPLDRIDYTRTLELNAQRHVPFSLEPHPAAPQPSHFR
jgi:hypothetical protein